MLIFNKTPIICLSFHYMGHHGWMGVNANVLIDDGGDYKSIIRKSLHLKHILQMIIIFFYF